MVEPRPSGVLTGLLGSIVRNRLTPVSVAATAVGTVVAEIQLIILFIIIIMIIFIIFIIRRGRAVLRVSGRARGCLFFVSMQQVRQIGTEELLVIVNDEEAVISHNTPEPFLATVALSGNLSQGTAVANGIVAQSQVTEQLEQDTQGSDGALLLHKGLHLWCVKEPQVEFHTCSHFFFIS